MQSLKDGYRGEPQLPPPEKIKLYFLGRNPRTPNFRRFVCFFTFQLPPQTFPVSATAESLHASQRGVA